MTRPRSASGHLAGNPKGSHDVSYVVAMPAAETLPPRVLLTRMGPAHLPAAAALHGEALPHGFFPRLGRSFLEAYLATYVDDPAGIAIAAVEDRRLVGFVVGSSAPATRRSHVLRRHGMRLGWRGVTALVRQPRLAVHFLRTRGGAYLSRIAQTAFKRRGVNEATASGRLAVLAHVAVDPTARGTGVGAALVHDFERQAADAGVARIVLVTLSAGGAGDFYRKLGWREDGRSGDRDGVQWTRFVREVA